MNDVMHGVARLDLPRRAAPNPRYSGSSVLAALRPDDAEEAPETGDPFAHMRARPKVAGGPQQHCSPFDHPAQPPTHQLAGPPPEDPDRALFNALHGAHAELDAAAASAPRDASGALIDYRPLLGMLESRGLKLTADAAGTLIAHLDVQGSLSFEVFMELIAESFKADRGGDRSMSADGQEQRPPPPQQRSQPTVRVSAPPAAAPAPTIPRGAGGAAGEWMFQPRAPPQPQANVSSLLGGKKASAAATNADLAALLNGGTSSHARRSDLEGATQGKSVRMR